VTCVALVVGVRLYREALARVLREEGDLTLAGEASTSDEALRLVRRTAPDVVLLDVGLPGTLAAMRLSRGFEAGTRFLAIGFDGSDHAALAAAEAGVDGYIGVDQPLGSVPAAIRSVMRGEAPCDGRVAAALLKRVAATAGEPECAGRLGELTRRQRLILQLLARGRSNKEIAAELLIEVATVKTHVHAILQKLDVANRTAAAEVFRESELVGPVVSC
jgi:two-component system, NarL family, nitrate/nitrite response regulator NarL